MNTQSREKDRSKVTKPKSKLVYNIVQIVENFAKKISHNELASIKVDEKEQKLVIEPKLKSQVLSINETPVKRPQPPPNEEEHIDENETEMLDELLETPTENPINIKQEEVFCDPISYIDTTFEQDDLDESQNDEEDVNVEYNFGASTSTGSRPAAKKRKTDSEHSEGKPKNACWISFLTLGHFFHSIQHFRFSVFLSEFISVSI